MILEKIPKMVQGYFKIEVIENDKVIQEYEDYNKVLVWVYKQFGEAVYAYNPPACDDFRISCFALGTDGLTSDNTPKDIPVDKKRLDSEDNFWNIQYWPPEKSYVYQVTFAKPSSYDKHLVLKENEGATWPHIYSDPVRYRGKPLNYDDELEAGMAIQRSFSGGILKQEFYLGKLAGNGHPAWDDPVKFSEAALYMPVGSTEQGDYLGTMFSMKTFPEMTKTLSCVIKITWDIDFNINN